MPGRERLRILRKLRARSQFLGPGGSVLPGNRMGHERRDDRTRGGHVPDRVLWVRRWDGMHAASALRHRGHQWTLRVPAGLRMQLRAVYPLGKLRQFAVPDGQQLSADNQFLRSSRLPSGTGPDRHLCALCPALRRGRRGSNLPRRHLARPACQRRLCERSRTTGLSSRCPDRQWRRLHSPPHMHELLRLHRRSFLDLLLHRSPDERPGRDVRRPGGFRRGIGIAGMTTLPTSGRFDPTSRAAEGQCRGFHPKHGPSNRRNIADRPSADTVRRRARPTRRGSDSPLPSRHRADRGRSRPRRPRRTAPRRNHAMEGLLTFFRDARGRDAWRPGASSGGTDDPQSARSGPRRVASSPRAAAPRSIDGSSGRSHEMMDPGRTLHRRP
jgi:hypothetical protein